MFKKKKNISVIMVSLEEIAKLLQEPLVDFNDVEVKVVSFEFLDNEIWERINSSM